MKEKVVAKGVLVSYENYYSRNVNVLVVNTIDVNKAAKACKYHEGSRNCDVKDITVVKNGILRGDDYLIFKDKGYNVAFMLDKDGGLFEFDE